MIKTTFFWYPSSHLCTKYQLVCMKTVTLRATSIFDQIWQKSSALNWKIFHFLIFGWSLTTFIVMCRFCWFFYVKHFSLRLLVYFWRPISSKTSLKWKIEIEKFYPFYPEQASISCFVNHGPQLLAASVLMVLFEPLGHDCDPRYLKPTILVFLGTPR